MKIGIIGSREETGVSYSLHRCEELGLNKKEVLAAALEDLGIRRYRLMSYWNIHEQKAGEYNFDELDWQLDLVAKYDGTASLCLGKRQPRWPECHIPDWAAKLSKEEWYHALYKYIEVIVKRYKDHPAVASWQLENEALLREFGYCIDQDYNRRRLEIEYQLIKLLDADHPVIMTLSDSWGLPWRRPHPDGYAISLYRTTINKRGNYAFSKRPALFYKIRAGLIYLIRRRPVFIHELQAEPWLAKGIVETTIKEQLQVIGARSIEKNYEFAKKTDLYPVDLWGLEWWYWLKEKHNKPECWEMVRKIIQ